MRRSDFIKGIIGFLGLSVLPKSIAIKQYQRIYLLQSFIRGFQYYDGLQLLDDMNEGQILELVREPENEYDSCAVALHYNQKKIGFLPREDNEMLSKLMDAELLQLQAEITTINKKAQSWEQVHIAVYVLKETDQPLPSNAVYLTTLETPRYRSLKISNNKVIYVYEEDTADNDNYVMEADEFYEEMVANSKNDKIYDILHTDFGRGAEDLQEAISNGRIIVNMEKLPDELRADKLVKAIEEEVLNLDEFFDENGYVVANVNRVANLSGRIERVVTLLDKQGRRFYNVEFL